jgi:hypothetical protein
MAGRYFGFNSMAAFFVSQVLSVAGKDAFRQVKQDDAEEGMRGKIEP